MAIAVARAYNGGMEAVPPAGSRGRAPGQGVRGAKYRGGKIAFRLGADNTRYTMVRYLSYVRYFL